MQPSDVFRLVRQYIRRPKDSWRQLKYWFRARHPQYSYSNGIVIFVACVVFVTFLLAAYCWPKGDYRLLAVPVVMVAARVAMAVLGWGWGKLHSPARKFKRYQRRR